jgi:hypothetical protein
VKTDQLEILRVNAVPKRTLNKPNRRAWSGFKWLISMLYFFDCFLLSAVAHLLQTGNSGANLQKEPRNNGPWLPGPVSTALSYRTEGKHSYSIF